MNNGERTPFFLVLIFFVIVTMTFSSCEPLRKKFTRQKKKSAEESEIIPILDPIEYPAKVYSNDEIYRQHYSLWQVWQKDLVSSIVEEESGKKQKYNLNQSIIQLEEIQKLVSDAKAQELTKFIDRLKLVQVKLDDPFPMRNMSSIRLEIESIGKDIREEFRFTKIKDSLKSE